MALGISERMIQRAFGAQDLSPIYNTLSAANQRIAAEDRARRIEAEKRYYTELADINKQRAGIREADIGRVTDSYNKWSSIEKQLSSNPSLITKNPEKYGQLKSEANALYSKMLTTIQASKEFSKTERDTYQNIVDPKNIDDWDEGADIRWKNNVMSKSIDEIRANNLDNMAEYRRKDVDGRKFYQSVPQTIDAVSKYSPNIPDEAYPSGEGVSKVFKYKNLLPDIDVTAGAIRQSLEQTISPREINKFTKQEFDKAVETGDYNNTINNFLKLYQEKQSKFKLPNLPEDIFAKNLPPKAKFINYLAAKQFISKYANPSFEEDFIEDPVTRRQVLRQERISDQIAAEQRREQALDKRFGGGPVKISPLFENASRVGEMGVSAMRETSNQFNSIGAADKMYPFTALEVHKNKEGYNIGSELASKDIDKTISRKFSVKNPNTEQGKQQLYELSVAINEANKNRGFLDSDITPEALRSGRVMILRTERLMKIQSTHSI